MIYTQTQKLTFKKGGGDTRPFYYLYLGIKREYKNTKKSHHTKGK